MATTKSGKQTTKQGKTGGLNRPVQPSPELSAIVGDKPNCFKWAFPMSGMMKVVMTVSQGSGVAAAQVFEK